jgi:RNA polymerase sigma-70 factor (ECF subfamily)
MWRQSGGRDVELSLDTGGHSREMSRWLMELRLGDAAARDRLIASAQQRLARLTRAMLRDFPGVRRWEETDDVFQNAMLRLCRSLEGSVPGSTAAFLRIAARDIRCALIDLARHYGGPLGSGRNQLAPGADAGRIAGEDQSDDTHEPSRLAVWSEFHRHVQELPDDLQTVMDVVWYEGLSHAEAAEVLQISERTVQRRWRQACLALHDAMRGLPPGVA